MIPVRLASARIPQKNIKNFCGTTLLEIAINKAKKCNVDEVWVNSPDKELSEYASKNNVNFYLRDKSLNNPNTTNSEFLKDFMENINGDVVFMLNTTSPLVKIKTLNDFIAKYNTNCCDTMLSVTSEQCPVLFKKQPINWSFDIHTPSENLEPIQKIVWAISAWKKSVFLANKCGTYSGTKEFFNISKSEAVDIDSSDDWQIAEAIFSKFGIE